jgi:peptidyl-prolyl cis-trans isomerase A (cyclophilin A)
MLSTVLLLSLLLASCEATITKVRFDLGFLQNNGTGSFTVAVNSDWAPLGAKRFLDLVDDGFWSMNGLFRCVPSFVIQWGLAADPAETRKWSKAIKDDPVVGSNVAKTISFATAGPNTRTTQLFVNLVDNRRLDSMGFAPFATVVDGWDTVQKINMQYRELPDQGQITAQGNVYLQKNFPLLSYIIQVVRVK